MATINLTKEGFQRRVADIETLSDKWNFLGDKPALIDFYASWCGPCKALSPVLEELADEYEGKVDIYKVNIDKEEALTEMFDIRSVPTLIFIPMNTDPRRALGAMPKEQLRVNLDKMINGEL